MRDTQKAYRVFLQSAFWKELSLRVRRKAGRCQRCDRLDTLQAHHVRYPENWYDTKESDLEVLCRECHANEHGKLASAMLAFAYREDEKFNCILQEFDSIYRALLKGRLLREKDEAFLDESNRLYPPTPADQCMAFQVELLRKMNRLVMHLKEQGNI